MLLGCVTGNHQRKELPMDRHCGLCGKTHESVSLARFYFEDDSWLCLECFGTKESPPTHNDTHGSEVTPVLWPARSARAIRS